MAPNLSPCPLSELMYTAAAAGVAAVVSGCAYMAARPVVKAPLRRIVMGDSPLNSYVAKVSKSMHSISSLATGL